MFKILKSPKVFLPFILMVVILALTLPRNGEFEYRYSKGEKWRYETLVSSFSFPILKTQEQMQAEKARLGSTYVPYYKYNADTYEQVCDAVGISLENENPELCNSVCQELRSYYLRGILPDSQTSVGLNADESQDVLYLQKDKRAVKMPREELYSVSMVRSGLVAKMHREYPELNVDSLFTRTSLYSAITPNLYFDKHTTELVHQESSEFISPTSGTFPAGDIIVSNGELITAEVAQILDSYREEYENSVGYNGPNWMLWLANVGLSLILAYLVFSLIYYIREKTFSHFNELLFIITLFVVACIVTFICSSLPSNVIYMIPYPTFALYYKSFFRKRLVLPLYVLCLLPLLICINGGAQLFISFLLTGFVGVFAFENFNVGWRQFITVLIIFATMLMAYLTMNLFNGTVTHINFADILFLGIGSLLCVLVYPLTFLFEKVFNLMSVNRLVELTDTNRSVLRELANKAPGTFQHSLALMNMADAVARSIDADVPLVRAAALYHDVGKMANPMCFIENQAPGVKYHENLSYRESASDIIRHVADGLAICEKHNVPHVIRDFVVSHHGTSTTDYFWTKHLNDGGDPSEKDSFIYPGPKPKTKEEAVLMICDTLEAASRTMTDFAPDTVSKFVDNIFDKKFNAGQFDEADITLGELRMAKNTAKNYITQLHHGRIAYPKRKK